MLQLDGGRQREQNKNMEVILAGLGAVIVLLLILLFRGGGGGGDRQLSETLTDLRERLAVMQAAQQQMQRLSGQVDGLERTLSNRTARGLFGEQQLTEIARAILPDRVLKFQATLSTGKRVDLLLDLKGPPGRLPVDAKFPLDSWQAFESAADAAAQTQALKRFEQHVTGHLRDIAGKYLVPGETANQALMFLPSDAVFAAVHQHLPKAIAESQRLRVWIVSPSNFAATLTTLRAILRESEIQDHLAEMQAELDGLLKDLNALDDSFHALDRHFAQTLNDMDQLKKLRRKIGHRRARLDPDEESSAGAAGRGLFR